jgi:ribulose 1,5-bisphosphate carboxylase large subunit-like protein
MPIVFSEAKKETGDKRVFGFNITEEQYEFMHQHKEVNWRATMRQQLESIIAEVKQPKKKVKDDYSFS